MIRQVVRYVRFHRSPASGVLKSRIIFWRFVRLKHWRISWGVVPDIRCIDAFPFPHVHEHFDIGWLSIRKYYWRRYQRQHSGTILIKL